MIHVVIDYLPSDAIIIIDSTTTAAYDVFCDIAAATISSPLRLSSISSPLPLLAAFCHYSHIDLRYAAFRH